MNMKILLGALLASSGFLLVPAVHQFVADKLGIKRQKLAFLGVVAIIVLTFCILPFRAQYVLGLIFICIGAIVKWIVPRHKKTRQYISGVLFNGVDITDESAPYAKVVQLFGLPLIALGLWVIAPITTIVLDLAAIAGAFWYWRKAVSKAEQKSQRQQSVDTISTDTTII